MKISLCICVVLSWDELKVRENLLDSDTVRLLVATVNWQKSLQVVKKSNMTLLPCLFMILSIVSIIVLLLGITFWQEPRFCIVFSPPSFISKNSHAIIDTDTSEYLPCVILLTVESSLLTEARLYEFSRHLEYYLWYTLANSPISFWNRLNPTFTMAGHFFWHPGSTIGTTIPPNTEIWSERGNL